MKAAQIVREGFIAQGPEMYAWPSMVRTRRGELLVAASARRGHDSPDGRIVLFRSRDEAQTWSGPTDLVNTELDDRHPTLLRTPTGVLLCAWITTDIWAHPKFMQPQWEDRARALTDEVRVRVAGDWITRSFDDGQTWDEKPLQMPIGSAVRCSPYGLSDGSLSCFGYDEGLARTGDFTVHYFVSSDLGDSWTTRARVPTEKTDHGLMPWVPWRIARHSELSVPNFGVRSLLEVSPGHLLALYATRWNPEFLRQLESRDGGRTWSVPSPTRVSGFAPFLLQASPERLHCFYTDRGAQVAVRAVTSPDAGKTWPETGEHVIEAWTDFPDSGFPVATPLEGGRVLVVYHVDRRLPSRFKPGPQGISPEGLLYRILELPL